ncbi:hypothetical protein MNBD_IGNAVI01-3135 [hydrothermal vent metagenome]|uniref:DUF481 domain-containing protein n=1 Tax=hydrothermal vent metagenome TaxID=652676 RepID=A0A3B1CBM2_9ZZZZ
MRKFQLFIIFILFAISTMYAQTDSLVFSKSETIIGEIKYMKLGVLKIGTNYSENDFEIEWAGVKEIYSNRTYIITLSDGERLIGTINTNPKNKSEVEIITHESEELKMDGLDLKHVTIGSKKLNFNQMDVVNIEPLDSGFWDQLSASIDFGYTFTKANNVSQFTLRSNLGYLTENWNADFSLDAVRSSQDSVENTQRTDINFGYSYFIGKNWFISGSANFLKNDEQKLKLRSTPKVGIGNFLVQTNHVYLSLSAGAAWNNETYTDPTIENRSTAEAYFGTEYNMFDFGDLSLLTNLFAYKSLNNTSRFRTDFKIDLKYDLPYDFYVKLGYTLNYDSQPVEGASQSDYVLQTTFGWEL